MFSKILTFITCLFITCAPESSEAGKIIPLTTDYQPPVYEEVKSYKSSTGSQKSCATNDEIQNTFGTGAKEMSIYKRVNDCERVKENALSMPKNVACQQRDGFHNMKLQFNRDFSKEIYFSSTSNGGFYKYKDILYYQINQGFLGADFIHSYFFGYKCDTKKSTELSFPGGYINSYFKSRKGLILGHQLHSRFYHLGYSISILSGTSTQQLNILPLVVSLDYVKQSDFFGYELIQSYIEKAIQDFGGIDAYYKSFPEAYDKAQGYTSYTGGYDAHFAEYRLKRINKSGKGILEVIIPGFKIQFNIDIFKRKIRW